jgi:GTP pyrophosphokinase
VVRRVFGGDQNNNAIRVTGQGDLLVYRARCCNPIRGEAIVGYVTRGKGVAVHGLNCPNVVNLMYEPERKIDVEWARDDGTPSAYPVKLTVFCDRRNVERSQPLSATQSQHPQHRRKTRNCARPTSISSSTSPT